MPGLPFCVKCTVRDFAWRGHDSKNEFVLTYEMSFARKNTVELFLKRGTDTVGMIFS